MLSNHTGFDVYFDNDDGTVTNLPGAVVKVRDVTDADLLTGVGAIALLPDLVADGSGHVAGGTLAVAAGRLVRFGWVRETDMACGFGEQTTT